MESPLKADHSCRSTKRKRPSSQTDLGVQSGLQFDMNEPSSMARGKQKAIGISSGCSLVAELKQTLRSIPQNASMALGLLDLYLCLWEFYVMDSAQKIRLEDEHRSLLDSNDWLLRQNEQLVHTCNCQTLLLWDRQQTIHDMHQGLTALIQGIK